MKDQTMHKPNIPCPRQMQNVLNSKVSSQCEQVYFSNSEQKLVEQFRLVCFQSSSLVDSGTM